MTLRRPRAVLAALAVLALAGCASGDPAAGGTGALTVVTSTNVYGSIARAVGGDRVVVDALITDPAADPHSYESTPSDAAKVAQAAVVVFNGGGYDEFMPQLVESAGGAPAVIDAVAVSGVDRTQDTFNEHVWYSLPAMQVLASMIATDLAAADPANAAEYRANAEGLNAEIAGLVTRTDSIRAAHGGQRVAITEPVPGYLVEAAGLTDATSPEFTEAIEEDTDPPAAVLQEVLALFGPDPVRALILNSQTETPTTDQVRQAAETAGVPVVEMSETLPRGAAGYVSWMGAQIDALAAALNGG